MPTIKRGLAALTILLLLPATASAATVTSPQNGATITTSRPVFRWTVGSGEACDTVRLSRGSSRDSQNRLTISPDEYIADTATSWQPYYGWELLRAGRWYYQLACTDTSDGFRAFSTSPRALHVRSSVSSLTVARVLSGRRASCIDCIDVPSVSFVSNAPIVQISVVVRRNGRVIGSIGETVSTHDAGTPHSVGDLHVAIGRRVKHRKRVRVTITAVGNTGGRRSISRRVRYRRG